MRHLAAVLLLSVILSACQQPAPATIPGPVSAITGTVVERVDGPPYSYLRLETATGEVWAAVPMDAIPKGGKLTLKNGAAVKNFTAPGIGRRFDSVVFGTLERQ